MSITREATNTITELASGNVVSAVNSAANVAKAGMGVAKKVGNLISKDDSTPKHIRDVYTNGFHSVGDESIFSPYFFARAFDEPTYLTFRIEFCFNDPVRNMLYNETNTGLDTTWNYAHMYDHMPEPFLQLPIRQTENITTDPVDIFNTLHTVDNLMSEDDYFTRYERPTMNTSIDIGGTLSTSDYLLKAQGDYGRHSMLNAFIQGIKDIQDNYPFYFTTINGLESLSTVDSKRGYRLKDATITIECLEALDLRITQLMQMYRKIVWDDVYQRWALPDMMRYFSMKIYVSEMRLFHEMRGSVGKGKNTRLIDMQEDRNKSRFMGKKNVLNNIVSGLNIASAVATRFIGTNNAITSAVEGTAGIASTINELEDDIMGFYTKLCNSAINKVMPTICYDCHMCEFDISSMMGHISSLSSAMKETKSPKPQIKIKVGQVTETQVYPLNKMLAYNERMDGYSVLKSLESNSAMSGALISDDALNKPIPKISRKNGAFGAAYADNLKDCIPHDGTENITIPLWRFGSKSNGVGSAILDDDSRKDLMYNIDDPGDMLAATALATAALNETGDLLSGRTGDSGIFSNSEVTNPQNPAAVQARNFNLVEMAPNDIASRDNVYAPESRPGGTISKGIVYANGMDGNRATDPGMAKEMGAGANQLPDDDDRRRATEMGSITGNENEYIINPYEGLAVSQETIWPGKPDFSATEPSEGQLEQAANFEIQDNGDPIFPAEPKIWDETSPYNATNPSPSELQQARNFTINDPGYDPAQAEAKIWNDKAEYTATEPSEAELQQARNFTINDPGYTPINTEPRIWDAEYNSTATNPDEAALNQAKEFEIVQAKDILVDIAEKIWDSPEIKSMATSDEMRAMVAEKVFNNVMDELYQSTATDRKGEAMRMVIQAYRNENGQ